MGRYATKKNRYCGGKGTGIPHYYGFGSGRKSKSTSNYESQHGDSTLFQILVGSLITIGFGLGIGAYDILTKDTLSNYMKQPIVIEQQVEQEPGQLETIVEE
ncbi:hypothetical protein KY334_05645 [Candidatus Woesearchaeota archaeon]|nr:hypothetical protein [Candidatus Woesearchaeota archaeon]